MVFKRALSAGLGAALGGSLAVGLIGGISMPAQAQAQRQRPAAIVFKTLNDQADPTFNQLLGINNSGLIAGYFGSGNPAATHPNKGYTLRPHYSQQQYTNENFPGSQQTQVVGINNQGLTVGFWVNAAGANFGMVHGPGRFRSVTNPMTTSNPKVNQLLGINDHGVTVGFYNDAAGNSHAYEYSIYHRRFKAITPPGAVTAQATGVNNHHEIVGFMTDAKGTTTAWRLRGGAFTVLAVPGAAQTQAFGVDNSGDVVGQFVDGANKTHGFLYAHGVFRTIDDPQGVGATTINGINDEGALVGFFTDAAGNTDGMLARLQESRY